MRCARLLRLVLAPLIVAMVAGSFLVSASSVRADDTISIASWNIRNVSDKSLSDAELGIISLVLFRYDFIALQEVLDEKVIERIQEILKQDFRVEYDFAVSARVGRNKMERYAFLWRKDKVAPPYRKRGFMSIQKIGSSESLTAARSRLVRSTGQFARSICCMETARRTVGPNCWRLTMSTRVSGIPGRRRTF